MSDHGRFGSTVKRCVKSTAGKALPCAQMKLHAGRGETPSLASERGNKTNGHSLMHGPLCLLNHVLHPRSPRSPQCVSGSELNHGVFRNAWQGGMLALGLGLSVLKDLIKGISVAFVVVLCKLHLSFLGVLSPTEQQGRRKEREKERMKGGRLN